MTSNGFLHERIDRILLASNDAELREKINICLRSLTQRAEIRTTHTLGETRQLLMGWHPILLIIDMARDNTAFLESLSCDMALPLAPFVLGIGSSLSTADVARAMRQGFSDVIDKPCSIQQLEKSVLAMVSRTACLPINICQIISPNIYNDKPIDLKKLGDEIEREIFGMAMSTVKSKNGLSRALGISRQLVQYHLRKREFDTNFTRHSKDIPLACK